MGQEGAEAGVEDELGLAAFGGWGAVLPEPFDVFFGLFWGSLELLDLLGLGQGDLCWCGWGEGGEKNDCCDEKKAGTGLEAESRLISLVFEGCFGKVGV